MKENSRKILISHYGLVYKNGWGRTFGFAKGLADIGNDVTIICTSTKKGFGLPKSIYCENVKIVIFSDIVPIKLIQSGYGALSLLLKIIYSLFNYFDIVHANSHRPLAYYPARVNSLLRKSKLVIEWWDNFEEKVKEKNLSRKKKFYTNFLDRIELRSEISTKIKSDGCVVLSSFIYKKAVSLNIPENRIRIIYGGCDVENISVTTNNNICIPKDTLTLGFIGMGQSEVSDLKPLFETLKLLQSDYKVKLLNYGREFSQKFLLENSLEDLIIECGWVDYYVDASPLTAVDIFVLIKQNNIINISGWPTKFGDYLACGKPILINLYGDLIDIHNEEKLGLITVDFDKNDIKEKVIDIINNKYDLPSMGKQNRKYAEKNTWQSKANELNDFYNHILAL